MGRDPRQAARDSPITRHLQPLHSDQELINPRRLSRVDSCGAAHKPRSVPRGFGTVAGWPFLYAGCCQPALAPYPPHAGPASAADCLGLLGLARGGVCLAIVVANDPVRSYHTFSPLPPEGALEHDRSAMFWRPFQRRFVSVALSLTQPSPAEPVGVTHHRVLSCSDFPRDRANPTPRPSRPRHTPIISAIPRSPFGLNRQGAKEGNKAFFATDLHECSQINHPCKSVFTRGYCFLPSLAHLAPWRFKSNAVLPTNWYLDTHDRRCDRTRSDRLGR